MTEEAFEHGADYVILPVFSFSGLAELNPLPELITEFERIRGAERLRQVARRNRGYLQFNHPVEADGGFWNETILLNPDGKIADRYHKRILAQIDQNVEITEGQLPAIVDLSTAQLVFHAETRMRRAERGFLTAKTPRPPRGLWGLCSTTVAEKPY